MTKWGARSYGKHAIDRLMGVIRPIHGAQPTPDPCVWLDRESREYADRFVSGLPSGRLLILGPGGGDCKRWPADNYISMVNTMHDAFGAVILLGTAQERRYSYRIRTSLEVPCLDLTGETSLLQAAALLRCADIFIGGDSGLGHIASAVGIRTITTFGLADPDEYRPWGERASVLMGKEGDAKNIGMDEMIALLNRTLHG